MKNDFVCMLLLEIVYNNIPVIHCRPIQIEFSTQDRHLDFVLPVEVCTFAIIIIKLCSVVKQLMLAVIKNIQNLIRLNNLSALYSKE